MSLDNKCNLDNQSLMDIIKSVILADEEWNIEYRLYLIQQLTKDYIIGRK